MILHEELFVTEIAQDNKRQKGALMPAGSNTRNGLFEGELSSWTCSILRSC